MNMRASRAFVRIAHCPVKQHVTKGICELDLVCLYNSSSPNSKFVHFIIQIRFYKFRGV